MSERKVWLGAMEAVLLVAVALRAVNFGRLPPGLYRDEAYNGLDALDVLAGQFSLYFPANNGREPLFIYLVAASVGIFGRSPLAVRLPALFVGVLTVAATGALGRALFSRRIGVLAAAVMATLLWHVHLSRVSFRAVLLPLLVALAAWQAVLGARTGKQRRFWIAGVLYGLAFYSYTAARFSLAALVFFALYLWIVRPRTLGTEGRLLNHSVVQGFRVAVIACVLTLLPLVVYTLFHPATVLGRPGQVSITSPVIHHGDFWGTLWRHTLRTAGMFFVRGDRIWRHNFPARPVFDPLIAAGFIAGMGIALRQARRCWEWGFVLLWMGVMVLPTLLAEDAPHFLRGVGVLPIVAFLPAAGLSWFADKVQQWPWLGKTLSHLRPVRQYISACVLLLPLLFALINTVWSYFYRYASDPMAGYWFEQGIVALASDVNRFLGVGWDGRRMQYEGSIEERRVYLEPRFWYEWPQVRFLIADLAAVSVGLEGMPAAGPVAVFVWPYDEWQRAWDLLPHPAEIQVVQGPISQGDRDPAPYVTYVAFVCLPSPGTGPSLAKFANGIELLDVAVSLPPAGQEVTVELRWRAARETSQDYTVFVHYLRDGVRIGQGDGPPAGGYYPIDQWRSGDIVHDLHPIPGVEEVLPGRDTLIVGLWQPHTGIHLDVLDAAGHPIGRWVELPVLERVERDNAR